MRRLSPTEIERRSAPRFSGRMLQSVKRPLLMTAFMIWLFYLFIAGPNGLWEYFKLQKEISTLQVTWDKYRRDNDELANRLEHIQNQNDRIKEEAYEMLYLGKGEYRLRFIHRADDREK